MLNSLLLLLILNKILCGSQVVNESIKFIFYLEDVISFVVVTLGETNFNTKSARKQHLTIWFVCCKK